MVKEESVMENKKENSGISTIELKQYYSEYDGARVRCIMVHLAKEEWEEWNRKWGPKKHSK